jgi:hypothetical protein
LLVGLDSWRASEPGNWPGRSLAIKPTSGGRATWQAVTRVKLEQASKVTMWMPTRRKNGEGRAGREETNKHLSRSAGVVSTACREGDLGQWGRPGTGGGRVSERGPKGATASLGVGEGCMTDEAE